MMLNCRIASRLNTDRSTSDDLKGLGLFCDRSKTKRSILATRSVLKDLGGTWAVPAPLLLLMDFKKFEG